MLDWGLGTGDILAVAGDHGGNDRTESWPICSVGQSDDHSAALDCGTSKLAVGGYDFVYPVVGGQWYIVRQRRLPVISSALS